jgi:glutamyl-tRNA synthetase
MTMRVRFAPSPTGYLHVGSARTALYNWLAARAAGGTFLLRSDDTDRERSDPEYYEDIVTGLRWLGLDWDEGIEAGGPHGTYRQSSRLERYRVVARTLVASGAAYPCFATAEQLDEFRAGAREQGRSPAYDGRFRVDPAAEIERWEGGAEVPIRFSVPRPAETVFVDLVRGEVRFDHTQVDDFVILRSDGTPTYHLASAVDDVDYEITHVVRGEDLLSSTPKHILLSVAMGREPITYAHLSLLMGPDGSKLSKRHGHTALAAYRDAGFVPEAMVNYLALLGWSPGDDETIVSLDEMARRFDLRAVSRNPAIFDVDKLTWMNGVYIREMTVDEFAIRSLPLVEADLDRELSAAERDEFAELAPLIQERAKQITDVPGQIRFLFVAEPEYDDKSWKTVLGRPEAPDALDEAIIRLESLTEWSAGSIEEELRAMLAATGLSARKGLQPLRVAATGSAVSPPLFESLAALGRERTLARFRAVRALL